MWRSMCDYERARSYNWNLQPQAGFQGAVGTGKQNGGRNPNVGELVPRQGWDSVGSHHPILRVVDVPSSVTVS